MSAHAEHRVIYLTLPLSKRHDESGHEQILPDIAHTDRTFACGWKRPSTTGLVRSLLDNATDRLIGSIGMARFLTRLIDLVAVRLLFPAAGCH
jgi:hypothetical protein